MIRNPNPKITFKQKNEEHPRPSLPTQFDAGPNISPLEEQYENPFRKD